MDVNVLAVILASLAMFVVGAVWYMVLFSKKWGEIHSMDKVSEKEMKELSASMGPYYGVQLVMTVVSAWALTYFIGLLPEQSPYLIAFWLWLGFVLPADVSSVIFGGTKREYIVSKIIIQASEALLRLLVAAWVISLF